MSVKQLVATLAKGRGACFGSVSNPQKFMFMFSVHQTLCKCNSNTHAKFTTSVVRKIADAYLYRADAK